MRRLLLTLITSPVLVGGLQACGKDSESTGKDSAADSSMASMPGMEGMEGMKMGADSASAAAHADSVTMSAAQIANGGIRWMVPPSSMVSGTIEVPGQLVTNEDRTARLAAPAQARVLAVHVSPGDRVERGTRLVTLQSQEANAAQADVAKARAEVASRRAAATYAKAARDRAVRLLELKAIPRQDYERAIADDELATAALTQAEAELARAQSGAEQLGVDPQSGAMMLRSPLAGVVVTRDVAPGAVVAPGTLMVTVTDPSSLWLAVSLPEQAAGGVRVGSTLRFAVAAFPSDTFTASVQSVSAAFDPITRSLPIRGSVANPRGRLRPEMFAKVWVPGGGMQSVITVPDSAVQRMETNFVVFVAHAGANGGARFEKREVQIRGAGGGRSAVLSGVRTGEAVVIAGAYAVKSQMEKSKMPGMEHHD